MKCGKRRNDKGELSTRPAEELKADERDHRWGSSGKHRYKGQASRTTPDLTWRPVTIDFSIAADLNVPLKRHARTAIYIEPVSSDAKMHGNITNTTSGDVSALATSVLFTHGGI